MAQKRGSQRGVVRAATSILLAAAGALLSLAGCSADEGSGGSERVGSVQQPLVCGTTTCVANDCFVYVCGGKLGTQCIVSRPKADLSKCTTASLDKGVCATTNAVTVCCPGCAAPVPLPGTGYSCEKGNDVAACGGLGECADCTADKCATPVCDTQALACANKPFQDGDKCSDGSGSCYQGSCCTGCIDKATDSCVANDPGHCGISTAGNGLATCEDCNDKDICTVDSCVKGACSYGANTDGVSCADGTKCNGDETCKGGKCTGPGNFSCDDSNVCTADSCDAQAGCGHAKLDGTACLDANKCNGDEVCKTGVCSAGTALNCNDNNACTTDSCSALNGCANTKLNGTKCEDANKCNGVEMCVTGACTAGTPLNCDDGNPCTNDDCDPAGGCTHSPVTPGTKCEDGDVCNGISACQGTVCTAGTPLNCDDKNVCTDDTCDKTNGCSYKPNVKDCSDNDVCTLDDKCDGAGSCKGGPAPNCDDNEACTKDTCDSAKGGCQHAAVADGGNCDDGNDCSTGDKCVAGKCKASGGKVCDDANACTKNACDPANGSVCTYPNEDPNTPCTFDKCHQNSICANGACSQGDLIDCDDANPCTTDSCDPASGCKHVADNAPKCSDGDPCTDADHCKSGVCVGTDRVCNPLDDCHEPGTCSEQTGVCDDPRAEDDKACKGGHCTSGKCVLDPVGAGGAGGETGVGGDGTSGSVTQGGVPGNPGETAGTTSGGKSSGGSTNNEAGVPEDPDHVFVRNPGGCSCSVPDSEGSLGLGWIGGLALAGLVAGRRRGRGSRGAANERKLV